MEDLIKISSNYELFAKMTVKKESLMTAIANRNLDNIDKDASGYQMTEPTMLFNVLCLLDNLKIDLKKLTFVDYGCGTGELFNFLKYMKIFKSSEGFENCQTLIDNSRHTNIIYKDVKSIKNHYHNIIYTFQITFFKKELYFSNLLDNLQDNQYFIECCDSDGRIEKMAKDKGLNYSTQEQAIVVYKPSLVNLTNESI